MIYTVRHIFICHADYDYLKSFDFTGHISTKMNVCWAYFAASPISKNEIKDARKQNDSLCTRRVSHIDETSVSIYGRLQLNERVLSWPIKNLDRFESRHYRRCIFMGASYNYY